MEKGDPSLRKVAKYCNIPPTPLSNHLNGRIRCKKVGPQGMLIEQEDETMVTWVLNMQKAKLYVNLQ